MNTPLPQYIYKKSFNIPTHNLWDNEVPKVGPIMFKSPLGPVTT